MSLPPGVPEEFEVRTVVFLMRGDDADGFTDEELSALQLEHLAYGAELRARGLTVAQGPLTDQADDAFRGLTVYTVGPEEAQAIADQDPSVRAGRLKACVASWWTATGSVAFPAHPGPVGDRRTIADM